MKPCKNSDCSNLTEDRLNYCSFKCRNHYTNKYLRDYSKNSKGLQEKVSIPLREKYFKNPKKCLQCGNNLGFDNKEGSFCSHSCSATFTNTRRVVSEESKRKRSEFVKKAIREGTIKIFPGRKVPVLREEKTKECLHCKQDFTYKSVERTFCTTKCRAQYKREIHLRTLTEKQKYYNLAKFRFNLKDYPDKFDFDLIKKHGMYKAKNRGDNPNGINRDHLYTISDGFKNNINPELLAHPANCKLITHQENIKKQGKSSITIEELNARISNW